VEDSWFHGTHCRHHKQFLPQPANIAQVDIRPENLGRRARLELGVVGDVGATIAAPLPELTMKTDPAPSRLGLGPLQGGAERSRRPGQAHTRRQAAVRRVTSQAYTIPTDRPEADGALTARGGDATLSPTHFNGDNAPVARAVGEPMTRDHNTRLGRREVMIGAAASTLAGGLLGRAAHADAEPLHFVTWSAAVDQVKSHLAAFEQKTGVKVDYSNSPWANYRETQVTKFVAGAPIDVLWVSDSWLPEWADAGWIAPVDQYTELTRYNGDITEFCTNSMTYKGRQYGVTYYSDHMAFYYNEEMLQKAGIGAPPQSWDEVVTQSLKLKQAGVAEFPVLLALARETWLIEYLSTLVFSHGGRFTDDKGMAVMDMPKTGCVEALRWVVDAVNKHKIVSPGCVETGELAALKAFSSGGYAFFLEPQYRMRALNDTAQSQIAGKVKQVLIPQGPNGSHATVGWMRFYGMTPGAQKDPARAADAVKLIEWFGGKVDGQYAFQKTLFLEIGAGFCTQPLYQDPQVRKSYETYGDPDLIQQQARLARKKDVVTPWFGEWNEVNGAAWQEAILQKATPEAALKRSAETWNKLKKEAG